MLTLRTTMTLCAAVALTACATPTPANAQGGDNPSILVIGEDADADTVPRNNRVFNRVLRAIQGQMNEKGFNVYDETAVTLGTLVQGRVRRDDAEIIEVCRAMRSPPLDVAVIFSIWPDKYETDIATYLSARVAGRILHCHTGRFLGTFEESFPPPPLPVNCRRDCILEVMGDHTQIAGRDVAYALAEKLARLVARDPTPVDPVGGGPRRDDERGLVAEFKLVLDNFSASDVSTIEEYIVAFSGYDSHRLVGGSATRQEFWYKTTSGTAFLRRNIDKMLDYERIEAAVNFSANTFTVKYIGRGRIDPNDFR